MFTFIFLLQTAVLHAEPGPAEPVRLCRIKSHQKVVGIYAVDTSRADAPETPPQKGVITSDHVYPCSDFNGARVEFNKRKQFTIYYNNTTDAEHPQPHFADLPVDMIDADEVISYDKKPVRAYFNHTIRNKIQINDKIGVNYKNRDAKGAKYIDQIVAGDNKEIYIIDAGFVPDYEDPLQHKTEGRLFYHVNIRDTKSGKVVRGWIDSGALSLSPVTTPLPKEPCPPEGIIRKLEEARGPLNSVVENARPTVKSFLDQFRCLKKGKLSFENYRTEFSVKVAQTGQRPGNLSIEQLNAIDALARTMYGEMRGCHWERGPEYSMVVARVALNRAENSGRKPPEIALLHELGKDQQFSAWNPGDPNLTAMTCIQGHRELQVWDQLLDIAIDTVLNPSGFKNYTQSVSRAMHYASNMEPWWSKTKTRLNNIQINGNNINEPRCIMVWD